MQSYDYTITPNKRKKNHTLLFENWQANLDPPHPGMNRANIGFIVPVVQKKNVFSLFIYNHHLEIGMVHHLNEIESSSTIDALCKVQLKLVLWSGE